MKKWFIIVNPTSGNGKCQKKWPLIKKELELHNFNFEYKITKHHNHAVELSKAAVNNGFCNFVAVGGDGTFHQLINGIFKSTPKNLSQITVAIIPVGTGNDWIKTYNIPINYKKAISIIKNAKTTKQDIGKITLADGKIHYFNNLAGIGFDAYVVNKITSYKNFGFLAYLFAGIAGILTFKKPYLNITFEQNSIQKYSLMLLIGLCKFSGGGMRLTKNVDLNDHLFDITYVESFGIFNILTNLHNIFNGKLCNHKLIKNFKSSAIQIHTKKSQITYIQADGELIGKGNFTVSIEKNDIKFCIP